MKLNGEDFDLNRCPQTNVPHPNGHARVVGWMVPGDATGNTGTLAAMGVPQDAKRIAAAYRALNIRAAAMGYRNASAALQMLEGLHAELKAQEQAAKTARK